MLVTTGAVPNGLLGLLTLICPLISKRPSAGVIEIFPVVLESLFATNS